jgi:hypothetical protein
MTTTDGYMTFVEVFIGRAKRLLKMVHVEFGTVRPSIALRYRAYPTAQVPDRGSIDRCERRWFHLTWAS